MLHLLSRSIRLFICASIVATIAATANAQFKASIAGTVKDASGALVSGVTVTVTSSETGRSQQTVTGDEGFFRVSELPPGRYTITAEARGFKKQVLENIIIHAEVRHRCGASQDRLPGTNLCCDERTRQSRFALQALPAFSAILRSAFC